ncbi:MAG: glycoside hydrolase family 3 N-terminal domain-containing protein, partial [Thermoleophilia bacterium]
MAEKDNRINNETEETGNGSRRADRRRSWYKNPFLLVGLAAFLIVIAAAGVLAVKLRGSTGSDAQAAVTTGTGTTSDNIVDSPFSSTSQQIAAMSVEEKVGQMMMVGFSGKSVDDSLRKLITADHVGNVVIDAGNVDSDQQVAALAASLQQLAVSANQPARMMIAAAQEGGKTRLFQNIGPNYSEPFIGNMRGGAGAIASQQTASEAARQLKRIGINTDLTPDADVTIGWRSIIDTRSYGNDPQVVAELTGAAVKGYNNA